MEGSGEILRIEARPADGQRNITHGSATGLINDETFKSLPEPYRVARYGASPNKIAITFDDGPDPEWTPKILDVLKSEHAPATFFLIGIQADKFSDIDRPHLPRRPRDWEPHLYPSRHQQYFAAVTRTVELNLTEQLVCQPPGHPHHPVSPAVFD